MATTVSYITPITNRKYADVEYAKTHQNDLVNKNIGAWNYTDANRVCNNLKYAAEYMYDQGFLPEPYAMQIKTNWTESDIITYEQLNTMIVRNMNNLKTYSRPDLEWHYIASIANMDYAVANWIEQNIHQLATQEPIPPDKYKLTVEGGTGSGEYEPMTVVNIQANAPEEGQVFSYWSGNHLENIGNANAAITTYTMPIQDVTLRANYTSLIPHTLTIKTYTNGTETFNLSMGEIKYIEADPAPQGKVFHHWEITPSQYSQNLYEPAASTHFTMPNEAVTLEAVYITKGEKRLIVTNGTPADGYYEYGTYVSIRSNKPSNGTFTRWTGDTQYLTGDATNEYNSVKIPDVNVIRLYANWTTPAPPPVTNIQLTVVNGVISSTGETTGTFTQGDKVAITANSVPEGQVFSGWSKSGGGSISNSGSMSATVTIGTSATTVTANYRTLEYHTLTVITDSGTTTTTKERYEYFSVNANPAPDGYTFDRWTGDTNSYYISTFSPTSASTGTYMGTADRTIVANYRPINPHTVTIHQLSGDISYTQAEFERITITAEDAPTGQVFTGWSLSGKGSLSSSSSITTVYTFGNGDGELTPNYVNIWNVSVVEGTINGSASATLRQGSSYSLRCRSLAVYERFDGWTKTGPGTISNTASTSTYFTVGEGDATLTANITQYPDKTLTVYSRDPDTGADTLVSQETYRYGTRITLEAPVAPNQTTFSTWLGDVNILSPSALASSVTINSLTADTTIIATYYYPQAPEYYTLSVYDGYPESGTYAVGSQVAISAKQAPQDWEFYKWYGDTAYLVDPDVTLSQNSIIMPSKSITLYAKFKMVGELPLFRVSVINGTASGSYETGEGTEESPTVVHNESGVYIDVPPGTEVTLTADPDVAGYTFDYWTGNFESAGVDDIVVTNNPTKFTMVEDNLNITMVRKPLDTYTVYTTDATGPGTTYEGTYTIVGNKQDTDTEHYTFTHWTCEDADHNDCISAIGNPLSLETTITLSDRDLWVVAHYTTHYKLTVVNGQDTGDGYYYEGETINTVYANTPTVESRLQFDHWDDPVGIITGNIYDPTPAITMKNSIATITAVFVSIDASGNSVAVTGNDLHTNIIRRTRTSLINGIFAVGTLVFDGDGCIGTITEVDPDHSDDTDDYRVEKLFYGGNT